MNRNRRKQLKKPLRCTLALLLAALMLSGSAFASSGATLTLKNLLSFGITSPVLMENTAQSYNDYLKEQYGDDWEKVAALQPGDSYVSDEVMYICHEETYVDWKRVYSKEDLDASSWGGGDRLLLMANLTRTFLFGQ